MSTPEELLTFPGLRAARPLRARAPSSRAAAAQGRQRARGHAARGLAAPHRAATALWERLWRPLLDSKFDGRYDDLPATYLWSRMRRTAGTRDRSGQEVMGWIQRRLPGARRPRSPSRDPRAAAAAILPRRHRAARAVARRPRARRRRSTAGFRPHDPVVTTQLRADTSPRILLRRARAAALGPDRNRYLGIVCLVVRARSSVSPYYALNITDRSVPLTSVVETTHVVDPEARRRPPRLPAALRRPGQPELERSSSEIRREYLGHVQPMFPAFSPERRHRRQVARARVAEPVHPRRRRAARPDRFPAPGLVVASSAHVYPEIVNGQADPRRGRPRRRRACSIDRPASPARALEPHDASPRRNCTMTLARDDRHHRRRRLRRLQPRRAAAGRGLRRDRRRRLVRAAALRNLARLLDAPELPLHQFDCRDVDAAAAGLRAAATRSSTSPR